MENSVRKREEQLQAKCSQWFWNTYPGLRRLLHHNDNNSHNAIEGARKKAIGVVKGIFDMELIVDRAVVFIELKIPPNGLTDEQKDFKEKVETRGHETIIIYSFEDFQKFINENLWRI